MGKDKKNEPITEVDHVDRNVVNIKNISHVCKFLFNLIEKFLNKQIGSI